MNAAPPSPSIPMPDAPSPVFWENLTWEEIPAALQISRGAVLWPIGATEQHGPHLGLGTDTIIARAVCEAVSARLKIPVLPALPVGCSMGHSRKWPGTLSLKPSTLSAVVAECGEWLFHAGVLRLLLINAHVTNFAPLRCALEELRFAWPERQIALINTAEISPRVRKRFFADAADWHANAAETALIWSISPDAARPDLFNTAADPDRTTNLQFTYLVSHTSANGVTGNPALATRQSGSELLEWMVEDLCSRVAAALSETPPLSPQSSH